MKSSPSFKQKFRYYFENTLSAGPIAIIGWLALASFLIVMLAAIVLAITGIANAEEENLSFVEAAWLSLMHTIDSGTIGGDNGWAYRAVMFLVTLGGIFIVSILIGTLTSGIEGSLDELRKGKSKVLETNHTLILGWSPKIFAIISELIIANENQKKPRIVILADKDKVEMDDEIRSKIEDFKNTKVICRTGSPLDLSDIQVVAPNDARSIIVLSPEEVNPDIYVLKSVLAITNNPAKSDKKHHIVAEIKDDKNLEAAQLAGGDEAVFVLSSDLIAKVTAQTCRQSGLSIVYSELLDFDGAEVYFSDEKQLHGKSFKEAVFAYENSAVMGVYTASSEVKINPPMDTLIQKGDKIIAISEDDDTLKVSNTSNFLINKQAIKSGSSKTVSLEKTLILGWNERGEKIVQELDSYVAVGSQLTIVSEVDIPKETVSAWQLKNQQVTITHGDITNRSVLVSVNPSLYDHIIILSYTETMSVQESDAKTLISLLHLRQLAEKDNKDYSIVSEMLDVRNRTLAEVTKADDFIVSDNLISLMMAQLSENKHLYDVFTDLFSPEGSEIYLKPITNYINETETVNFYTLLESASQKGELAIGYRMIKYKDDATKAYGVVINPKKSDTLQFTKEDKLIVLAEN